MKQSAHEYVCSYREREFVESNARIIFFFGILILLHISIDIVHINIYIYFVNSFTVSVLIAGVILNSGRFGGFRLFFVILYASLSQNHICFHVAFFIFHFLFFFVVVVFTLVDSVILSKAAYSEDPL